MNSFMPWVGGKRALREIIVACFPSLFERYIEVFGGAGWVLFHKRPGPFEVYNDYNSLLANLFRCVRDKPDDLKEALRYVLNSREDFKIILDLFDRDAPMSDIDKAAKFYQLIRFSYAAGCDSYSCQPHNVWSDFPAIDGAHYRLRTSGVIVENKDFGDLIRHYDRPESFFYLDPPYFGTEKHYRNSNFSRDSHQRLFDTLITAEGSWLLSYTLDCSPSALKLASNEYITNIRFEFGTVKAGFHEDEAPAFIVNTLATLPDGYRIVNRTNVGGKMGDKYVTAKDTWITVTLGKPKGKLPKTGF